MPRKDMTDAKIAFACQLFLSLDSGKSWHPWGGMGTVGGKIMDSATKKVAIESGMEMKLPKPENAKRKLMATLTTTSIAIVGLDMEFK